MSPFAGRAHRTQAEQLKQDALLRLSIGGLTLTLLQEDPPSQPSDRTASMAGVSEVFFQELAFFKDSMFNERDFHHLRGSFAKACPHSHLRLQRNTKEANYLYECCHSICFSIYSCHRWQSTHLGLACFSLYSFLIFRCSEY